MNIEDRSSEFGEPVVSLRGLSKLYEPTPRWMRLFARSHISSPVQALDGVDLSVPAGQICAIVGPNGAGKTTLFRIMVGLTNPTSGSGSILGYDIENQSEHIRQVVGWMPSEDRSLLMRATCKENLVLHGGLQGMSRKDIEERSAFVLEAVNLTKQRQTVVTSLSAGMKARLRLARALLPGPRALILDEPTGAVDPIAAHGLLHLIMEITEREQLAVLISSHRLEEIEALQARAVLMDGGRVRFSGDLSVLRHKYETPVVQLTFDSPEYAADCAQRLRDHGYEVSVQNATVRCPRPVDQPVGEILAAVGPVAVDIRHVREEPMALRDLIAEVYQDTGDRPVPDGVEG